MLRRRSFLHLGTEVARTGGVPADRAASAVRTVRRLGVACEEAGVDVVVALATAALRDADNGSRLINRLEQVLGSPITLLTGEEEARLCFLGQRAGVWVGHDPVLGLDLGGGSLEAGIGTIDEVIAVASVALGTARLRGELGTGELLTAGDRVAISRGDPGPCRADPGDAGQHPKAGTRVIASGGTVRALARLAMGLHRPLYARARVVAPGQPGGDPCRPAARAGGPPGHPRPRCPTGPARHPGPAGTPAAHRGGGALDPGREPGAAAPGGQRMGTAGGRGDRRPGAAAPSVPPARPDRTAPIAPVRTGSAR